MRDRLGTTVAFSLVLLASAPAVTSGAQTGQRMPSLTIESIAGRDNFERYCAACHGSDGRGAGPVATALNTPPADLASLARRNGGSFPRDTIVAYVTGTARDVKAHGAENMPVWGPIFRGLDPSAARTKQRIDNVVTYIESIQTPSTGVNDPGAQLFRTHCATCHGTTARGNGPIADQLRRLPADLTKYTARNGGVFPSQRVSRIIDGRDVPSHGNREMPVWGDAFKTASGGSSEEAVKARIAAIVKYLESIQERAARLSREAVFESASAIRGGM